MRQDIFNLWNDFYFSAPDKLQLLWIAAGILLLGIFVWLLKLYKRPAKTYRSKYPFLGKMKFWFALVLTLSLCIVAYARPYFAKGSVKISKGNVDVIFVVDYSASMFLKDTGLARIDIAGRETTKTVSGNIIKEGDRTAIFIFGKIVSPRILLTRDLDSLASEIDKIGLPNTLLDSNNDLYWGSAIGTTFGRIIQSLDRWDMIAEFGKEVTNWQPRYKRNRLIIFISDGDFFNYGENNEETKAKAESEKKALHNALLELRKRGLPVYAVGIGTQSWTRLSDLLRNYITGNESYSETLMLKKLEEELKGQVSRLNVSNLHALATATGGQVFTIERSSSDASEFIRSVIDQHRNKFVEPIAGQDKQELWLYFLLAALAAFLGGMVVTKF